MYLLTVIIVIIIISFLYMYSSVIYDEFEPLNIESTNRVHRMPHMPVYIPNPPRVGIYAITYNCPKQFQELLKSLESNDFLRQSHARIVLNNSTDRTTDDMYAELCAKYNFTEIKKNNIGITGGRKFLAQHFADDPELTHYYYFEDDMLLTTNECEYPECQYGYPRHIPNLFQTCLDIAQASGLNYLKLSYCEINNTNYYQFADFGTGTSLPPVNVHSVHECSHSPLKYAVGEYFYCNWPSLMDKHANHILFIEHQPENCHEQTYLVYSVDAIRKNKLKSGCLLACAVNHERKYDYNRATRFEAEGAINPF